jgi:steroid 5-alpha reductase family enzyme
MDLFISAFALTAVVILVFMTFFYLLSLILQRSDIVDIGWGLGFIFVTISLFLRASIVTTQLEILTILVTLWGLRLATHIFIRNKGKKEDFRYQNFKEQWGKGFWWKSYFKIFILQGVFMLTISIPLIYAFTYPTLDLTWLDYVGIGIWVFGSLFESIGDYQLSVFISKKKKGKTESRFLESGLWSLTRHPNYFGEVVLWWGIWLIAIDLTNLNSLYTIIGPLTISYLIIFVSGVPLLEEKYEGNKEWEKYKKRVPKFFPLKLK